MKKVWIVRFLYSICAVFLLTGVFDAQSNPASQAKSREVSEDDGVPVLTKHLPDWENILNRATYILNQNDLQNALGARPVFDLIEFESGTEAVTAPYNEGKLLLIEYSSPQSSIDADNKINQRLTEIGETQSIVYRRIGNYNVFVFDAIDQTAANALLDQIKYQKSIQWLGEDPFLLKRAERAMVKGLSELFVSTVLAIVGILGLAILLGLVVGFVYFRLSDQRRAQMSQFTDAGGMTRLNLDGFTPEIVSDRLLQK